MVDFQVIEGWYLIKIILYECPLILKSAHIIFIET